MVRIAVALLCLLLVGQAASAQQLLWEHVQDVSGGIDLARAITLSKKSVVIIGNSANSSTDVNDFVVESFRRVSGAALWTAGAPEAPGLIDGLALASAQGRVFAAGYAAGGVAGSTDIVIRSYDAVTGTLLWNSVWDAGRDDLPKGIVAGARAVVAVGYGANSGGQPLQFIVRAYDPASGSPLWEDRVSSPTLDAKAWTVATTRDRVFVAGNVLSGDLLLRAYHSRTGALLWESKRPATLPTAIKADHERVVLAGASSNHYYVGAFGVKNGTLLWEDQGIDAGLFRDVALEGDRVMAAGSSQSGALVRDYDAASGTLAWEKKSSPPPGFSESGAAIVANGTTVYLGGSSRQDFGPSQMLVQAFDEATGMLLWDDRSHPTSNSGALDLALGKNRLFVAGVASNPTFDFVIRAYDIRKDRLAAGLSVFD